MDVDQILERISTEYQRILRNDLVGIYVHGSIAFHCFNWDKSDIDFLVVVKDNPTQNQKELMIRLLLELTPSAPKKGLEMSVVLAQDCNNFIYPTPFYLHFSNMHLQNAKNDLATYCRTMNGVDCDLAAHFTVVKHVGICQYGQPINEIFRDVPKKDYLASILSDIEDAKEEVKENPISTILNLCRVYAYIKSDFVLSKESGGYWAIENLPKEYTPLIQQVLESYSSDKRIDLDCDRTNKFCDYMKTIISQSSNH